MKQLRDHAGALMGVLDHEDLLSEVLNDSVLSQVIVQLAGISDASQRDEESAATIACLANKIRAAVDKVREP